MKKTKFNEEWKYWTGSDAFALVWTKGELHGLNASGRAPMAITAEKVKKQGCPGSDTSP